MGRLSSLTVWFSLAGCPWIGFQEHRENHAALTTDADADTDADSDTDSDTDADTDTLTGETAELCIDDAQEPNDFAAQAHPVDDASTVDGVLCPDDLGQGGIPVPTDAYTVQVGPQEVLLVEVRAGATTACDEQTFEADLTGLGTLQDVGVGGCPTLVGGGGPGTYVVELRDPTRSAQDYALSFSTIPCSDDDGDEFLDDTCGGPDCDDMNVAINPSLDEIGALMGDRVDQDCDGLDDLNGLACTPNAVGTPMGGEGTLDCGDLDTDPVWDAWLLPPIAALGQVNIAVQNGVGSADLLAYVVDASGTAHFGFEPDRSQFDDGLTCPAAAWTGSNTTCPGACYLATTSGRPTLWVAQHQGAGCTDAAEYRVILRVGANQVTVSDQITDDGVLTR